MNRLGPLRRSDQMYQAPKVNMKRWKNCTIGGNEKKLRSEIHKSRTTGMLIGREGCGRSLN